MIQINSCIIVQEIKYVKYVLLYTDIILLKIGNEKVCYHEALLFYEFDI